MQRLREEKPRTVLFLSYLDEEGGRISFLHAFPDAARWTSTSRARTSGRSRVRVHRAPRVGVVRTDERAGDGGYASKGGEVRRPRGGRAAVQRRLPAPGTPDSPRGTFASTRASGCPFLDELGEFPVNLLDALLQPIEEGRITIARALRTVCFPAEVQLVAATNPCPCGFEGDGTVSCRCRPSSRILVTIGAWWERAAWAGLPTGWSFPNQGESTVVARGVCARCPVRVECLEEALSGRSTKTMGFGEARPNCSGNGSGGRTAPESRRRVREQLSITPTVRPPPTTSSSLPGERVTRAWHGPRRASP